MRRDREPGMEVCAGLLVASTLMVALTVAIRAISEAAGA